MPERAGKGSFTLAVSELAAETNKLEAMGVDTSQQSSESKVKTVMVTDPPRQSHRICGSARFIAGSIACRTKPRSYRFAVRPHPNIPVPKTLLLNLTVTDLVRSTAFYEALDATKNAKFSDETSAGMVFSESIRVMPLTHDKYRQCTSTPIAVTHATSAALIALGVDSRA